MLHLFSSKLGSFLIHYTPLIKDLEDDTFNLKSIFSYIWLKISRLLSVYIHLYLALFFQIFAAIGSCSREI